MKPFQKASLKFFPFLFLIAVPFIYSCKEKTPPKTVETSENSPATNPDGTKSASFSNDNTALNPAHGQPGHRCDIKVGEPLNSSSNSLNTNTTPTTTKQSSVILDNSAVPAGKKGSGEINPAHGQPGHVCGVPVGSPL